jgi:hypothetical protein
MTNTKSLPSDVTRACREINAFVTKLARAEKDVDNYQRSIGQHIRSIKKRRPKDWLAIIERQCNLKKTRVYELLQIASGHKTPEQVRGDANRRKIKHRVSVPERKEADAEIGVKCEAAAKRIRQLLGREPSPTGADELANDQVVDVDQQATPTGAHEIEPAKVAKTTPIDQPVKPLVPDDELTLLREFAHFVIGRTRVKTDLPDHSEWKALLGKVKATLGIVS